jgi:hypothetical protein
VNAKKPEPAPAQPIRVMIVGDHPWTGNAGWIYPEADGTFRVCNVLGTGPDMLKVKLDNGQECYAEKQWLRTITARPTSPPPPRKKISRSELVRRLREEKVEDWD